MVRFKCGFVPIGIFSAMIACLISNKSFVVIEEGILKNVVQFRYGVHRTLVTLLCCSMYYELIVSEFISAKLDSHEECAAIRKEIEATFELISDRVHYGFFMDYQFAFECPLHSENGRDHLCVLNRAERFPVMMDCLHNPRNLQPVELSDLHILWFGQVRTGSLNIIRCCNH